MSLPTLDLDRAVPFLLAEGLLDVSALVDGDFRLLAASTRCAKPSNAIAGAG